MTLAKILPLAAVLTLLPTIGYGQSEQVLDDLEAERLTASEIKIEFEYTGGACEEVGPAQPGEIVDGKLAVTFPTTSTAEVCTMQAMEIDVEQSVAANETVTAVEVTLLAPDGSVAASGTGPVEDD